MKILIIISIFLIAARAYSQQDSTTIKFKYLGNELSIIADLSDIQYVEAICSDTNMHGKRFMLSFEEYLNGKKINENNSLMDTTDHTIPYVVGNDSIYKTDNIADNLIFDEHDSIHKIIFAGKLQNDTFRMKIECGLEVDYKMTGDKNYSLRDINFSGNEGIRVAINKLTPIVAYSPPLENSEGDKYYCILGSEKVDIWYEKFKLKHYYIINLKIE
jgi:hypothetical protein